eukprot:6483933-Amphidinium_carterae.3
MTCLEEGDCVMREVSARGRGGADVGKQLAKVADAHIEVACNENVLIVTDGVEPLQEAMVELRVDVCRLVACGGMKVEEVVRGAGDCKLGV